MPVRLEFRRPVRTARGEFRERQSVLFELRDVSGIAGYGEAAPWPGFGEETPQSCRAVLDAAASLLKGAELIPGEWTSELGRRFEHMPVARAAVEGALWDLEARRTGQPLAACLALSLRPRSRPVLGEVPAGALLLGAGPDEVGEQATRARTAGFRAAKLKLGAHGQAADVARAEAARAALGADVELRGDANGAWRFEEALAALAALAPFGFAYVEQPLPAADLDGLAALRRSSPVRIAADESVVDESAFGRLLELGAADVLVLKPSILGGPARALALAATVQAAGVDVVFSHAFDSAVGARQVLHCAAAWGDPATAHGVCTEGLFVTDVAAPVECRHGSASVGDAPGLGIQP
jgi:o-succinylbenzoate synthase